MKKIHEPPGSEAKKAPQPLEQEAEVVTGGGEQYIDLVAFNAFEIVAAEVTLVFEMADERLDDRSAFQFLLDGRRHPAFLS